MCKNKLNKYVALRLPCNVEAISLSLLCLLLLCPFRNTVSAQIDEGSSGSAMMSLDDKNGSHRLDDAALFRLQHTLKCAAGTARLQQNSYHHMSRFIRQNEEMVVSIVALLLGALFFSVALFLLGRNKRRISSERDKMKQWEAELEKKAIDLSAANERLRQSSKKKDDFIGLAFNSYAAYMSRIVKLYKTINHKLMVNQYSDLLAMFSDAKLQEEHANIFTTFDTSFLYVYPDFVDRYNELFSEENRISPPAGNKLTNEMRIFALIKLGISNTEQIARFMNYSVNTVNAYKTRAKNKSLVDNADFEQRVMDI